MKEYLLLNRMGFFLLAFQEAHIANLLEFNAHFGK